MPRQHPIPCRAERGFTLVELMVGLAVGLFVSVIAISLFVSTRKLQTVNSAGNRMAENARLALDLLHKDLRLVGFRGCTGGYETSPTSVLAAGNGDFLVDANGIRGHRGNGGGFSPPLSGALAGADPLPSFNSDVVSVRVPADAVSLGLETSMPTRFAAPTVGVNTNGANLITRGDIVLMANCKSAVLFQVTDPAAGVLSHAVGGGLSPGNASLNLGVAYNRADTAIYRMQTRHYYVAPSVDRPGTNSLWRLTVPGPAGAAQVLDEVVPGVNGLKIRYGIETDTAPDRAADRYVTAGTVTDWNNVLSARIEMLTATTDDGTARAASSVQFAGGTVVGTDRRLREVFTEVISFRNQTP